jgi:hypothetical protein
LSARSGVSKNTTWRICASSTSISSATAERRSTSGTVSFSSTLSAPLIRLSTSGCSSVTEAGWVLVIVTPPSQVVFMVTLSAPPNDIRQQHSLPHEVATSAVAT